jgi:hypothetical protein
MEICQMIKNVSIIPLYPFAPLKEQEVKIRRLIKMVRSSSQSDDFSRIIKIINLWQAIVTLNTNLFCVGQEQIFWLEAEEIFEQLRENSDDIELFQEIVEGDPLFS